MEICPQTISPILEILCYVKVRRKPGQPTTGRCNCELAEPWPVEKAGEKQPTSAQLNDRLPGSVAVVRRSTFKFAGGPVVRCDGPLRYEVCKYKRHIDIMFNSPIPLDSYDSPDLFEVEELVGVCPVQAIKDILGIGSAVRSLLSISSADVGTAHQALAQTFASNQTAHTYDSPMPILSQHAFAELSYWTSSAAKKILEQPQLACLESGRADISDIVDELNTVESSVAGRIKSVLERVANSSIRTSTCGLPDDLWLTEALAVVGTSLLDEEKS